MSLPPPPDDPHALQPVEIGGPGRTFFANPAIDGLMDAVVELSAELWAVKDRQYVMERVLAEEGLTARIEQWRPSPHEAAERKALREAFVARIFNGFLRSQPAPEQQDGGA
jgi:hypothetical protein